MSGVQRALRFSPYLTDFGWDPIVLTLKPVVYDYRSSDLLKDVRPVRASMAESLLLQLSAKHGVSSAVKTLPPIDYSSAIKEMQAADGLVILQASNCNDQIPAKIYEYFRSGRPILVLSDPEGDTAGVARQAGISNIAPLDDVDLIYALLVGFLEGGARSLPSENAVASASRYSRTRELAAILDSAIAESP